MTDFSNRKHRKCLGAQPRPQYVQQNNNGSFNFIHQVVNFLELGHKQPNENAQDRGNERKNCPHDACGVKDIGVGLLRVHAFDVDEVLTKGGDDTANTKDGHEAVRPKMWLVVEGKEEKEKESEGVSFRKELEGGNELEEKVIKIKNYCRLTMQLET